MNSHENCQKAMENPSWPGALSLLKPDSASNTSSSIKGFSSPITSKTSSLSKDSSLKLGLPSLLVESRSWKALLTSSLISMSLVIHTPLILSLASFYEHWPFYERSLCFYPPPSTKFPLISVSKTSL